MRTDWIAIVAGEEGVAELRRRLLALAQHPGHVRTHGAADEFIVPPYLAKLYMPRPKPEAAKPPAPVAPPVSRRRPKIKEEGDE